MGIATQYISLDAVGAISDHIIARRIERQNLTDAISVGSARFAPGFPRSPVRDFRGLCQPMDYDVLNFVLNLEYLEAEYYLAAIGSSLTAQGASLFGTGVSGSAIAKDRAGNPVAGDGGSAATRVPFTNPLVQKYAEEIANDEYNHVVYLRAALAAFGGTCAARPAIDLYHSFLTVGDRIGVAEFDPFANDLSFLLGACLLEDIAVMAYHGGAGLLRDKTLSGAVAGILGVEAYHASEIRTTLNALDYRNRSDTPLYPGIHIARLLSALSKLRGTAEGKGDISRDAPGTPDATGNGSATFTRTTMQVLNLLYLTPSYSRTPEPGGFFPLGLNGNIA